MQCHSIWTITSVMLISSLLASEVTAQEEVEVRNIEYLHGVSDHPNRMSGTLRISTNGILFIARRGDQFSLERQTVDYVAAHLQARQRALVADVGSVFTALLTEIGIYGVLGTLAGNSYDVFAVPLLAAAPFHFLLKGKERRLLSVEYLEGDQQVRRLALFRVRSNSANVVKKLIDAKLGLNLDYYRDKDLAEEARRQAFERQVKPSGFWEAPGNTVIGNHKRTRILVEKHRYAVLICYRYIGLKPEGMSWAKYRIPVREVTTRKYASREFAPIYKGKRLVGFEIDGRRSLFY